MAKSGEPAKKPKQKKEKATKKEKAPPPPPPPPKEEEESSEGTLFAFGLTVMVFSLRVHFHGEEIILFSYHRKYTNCALLHQFLFAFEKEKKSFVASSNANG